MIEIEHENLAVADLSGFRRRRNRVGDFVHLIGMAGDLDFDLGQETHGIFGATIDFGMTLLPPVALHFGDGQALDADLGQRVADLVEFEWLDNGHYDFHWTSPRRRLVVLLYA